MHIQAISFFKTTPLANIVLQYGRIQLRWLLYIAIAIAVVVRDGDTEADTTVVCFIGYIIV